MKQCNFQNNYGTIAERFLVVHLYSTFSMDPLDFFWGGGNLYKKIAIFGDFGGRKATFLMPQW